MAQNSELDSHQWDRAISPPMDGKKHAWFQRELNKIVGTEPNGVERFKLVWLPHYEVFNAYRGEMQLLFAWGRPKVDYKADPATGILMPKVTRIGVPRYALLGFTGQYTPRQLQHAGQEDDGVEIEELPEGKEVNGLSFIVHEKRISYHATPHLPQYRVELIFAEHLPRTNPSDPYRPCCWERAFRFDRGYDQCYGRYVEPDEEDLRVIRQEMKEYEELFRQHPSGTITESQYAWIRRTEAEARQKEREALEADRAYLTKHNENALHKAMERAIRSSRATSLPRLKSRPNPKEKLAA